MIFGECGTRWDTREWADDPRDGITQVGANTSLLALPGAPIGRFGGAGEKHGGKKKKKKGNHSRFSNANVSGDDDSAEDRDSGSESDEDTDESGDDDDTPEVDFRLQFQASEAVAALELGHEPVGGIKRVVQRRLREADSNNFEFENSQTRRLGNTLAICPWPDDGLMIHRKQTRHAHDDAVAVARTFGKGAAQVRVGKARLVASSNGDAQQGTQIRLVADYLVPTRRGKQPVLQIELSSISHCWLSNFAAHAQPVLCAVRDPSGVSLSAVGGGVFTTPALGRPRRKKPKLETSTLEEPKFSLAPDPALLWCSSHDLLSGACPSDIALSPHGLPELLIASRNGGLTLVDAAGLRAAKAKDVSKPKNKNKPAQNSSRAVSLAVPENETAHAFGDSNTTHTRWVGCAYGNHPRVALIATARTVRRVDLRVAAESNSYRKCLISELLVDDDKGNNAWRALCGPPIAEWSPSSFQYGRMGNQSSLRDTHHSNDTTHASFREYAFALACDDYVSLFDLRKPSVPMLRWRHEKQQAPAWVRFENASPWRDRFRDLRCSADTLTTQETVPPTVTETVTKSNALLLAGFPSTGEVLSFEFGEVPGNLDGQTGGGVRALGAGSSMPLEFGKKNDEENKNKSGLQGFAMLPPKLFSKPSLTGGLLWATLWGDLRWATYDSPSGIAGGCDSTAPLVFDAGGFRGGSRTEIHHPKVEAEKDVQKSVPEAPPPFSEPAAVSTTELRVMFGAASGVVDMPKSNTVFGEATARAAAGGAKRAADAAAKRFGDRQSSLAPKPKTNWRGNEMTAENTGKAKTLPLVGDFIARGVLPFLETNPGELGVPVLPPPDLQKITARAAKLLRGLGGWKATAFELALASVSSTDDSGGGGARDVSVWVNSRTACGGFRHRAVRDRMAAVPKKEQEETVAEEGVQGTKGRGSGTQETTATNPRSVRAKVGSSPPTEIATPADGNRLAAVLGVGGDVSRDANSPHHSWLRGVSVWLEDGAVADGAMTYELVPIGDDPPPPAPTTLSSKAAAARASLIARWGDFGETGGGPGPSSPSSRAATPFTKPSKGTKKNRRVSFAPGSEAPPAPVGRFASSHNTAVQAMPATPLGPRAISTADRRLGRVHQTIQETGSNNDFGNSPVPQQSRPQIFSHTPRRDASSGKKNAKPKKSRLAGF